MNWRRFCHAIAGLYLVLAFGVMWLELQPHPYAAADMTGLLSALVTLPIVFAVNAIALHTMGVHAGDSHRAFVTIVGLAALVNASAIVAFGEWITRTSERQRRRLGQRARASSS